MHAKGGPTDEEEWVKKEEDGAKKVDFFVFSAI